MSERLYRMKRAGDEQEQRLTLPNWIDAMGTAKQGDWFETLGWIETVESGKWLAKVANELNSLVCHGHSQRDTIVQQGEQLVDLRTRLAELEAVVRAIGSVAMRQESSRRWVIEDRSIAFIDDTTTRQAIHSALAAKGATT